MSGVCLLQSIAKRPNQRRELAKYLGQDGFSYAINSLRVPGTPVKGLKPVREGCTGNLAGVDAHFERVTADFGCDGANHHQPDPAVVLLVRHNDCRSALANLLPCIWFEVDQDNFATSRYLGRHSMTSRPTAPPTKVSPWMFSLVMPARRSFKEYSGTLACSTGTILIDRPSWEISTSEPGAKFRSSAKRAGIRTPQLFPHLDIVAFIGHSAAIK